MSRLSLPALLATVLLAGCQCTPAVPTNTDAGGPSWDGGLPSWLRDGGAFDGGGSCGLVTCASAQASCGPIGDGCGGTIQCGDCAAPESCGGGGVPSKCGGTAGCAKATCASAGANCGPLSDGCGGLLSCGSCSSPEQCGGGGVADRCGLPGTGHDAGCSPFSCPADGGCGAMDDGCGTVLQCGTCGAGEVCGGATPNLCVPVSFCPPRTCGSVQAACGYVGDGCGSLSPLCGTCDGGLLCGSLTPNQCGSNVPDSGCVGLCPRQVHCDASTTTVTGVVLAPTDPDAGYGQPDPIPGALVYVPNAKVLPLAPRGACTQCAGQASGNPLVQATSGTDGTFTLTNVPCGASIPLVIQLGRWRRQVTIPQVACCGPTNLPGELTRLPRNASEGDIPSIAIVTGSADPIECVLPKLGLDRSNFSLPDAGGRVHFYVDNGVNFDGGAPPASALWSQPSELARYDLVIADCVGSQVLQSDAGLTNVRTYVDTGGRLYASHFSYVWLYQNAPFSSAAAWQPNNGNNRVDPPNQSATIDTSFPKGVTFSDWMALVGGSAPGKTGKVAVQTVRSDTTGVIAPTQSWLTGYRNVPPKPGEKPLPLQFTFNTPVGAAQQCGRVLFSDFHVATGGSGTGVFPGACGAPAPMSPQEKVLEFMLFDLTSCIQPDVPASPTCTPQSCTALGLNCGQQSDGCSGSQDCGTCAAGLFCGAGGKPGVCGVATCVPLTCAEQGVQCGTVGDGCGGTVVCPPCPTGQLCGLSSPGQCAPACVPQTCQSQHLSCGPAGDGCGGTLDCSTCAAPDTCGGGGTPGVCGHSSCTPRTCTGAGASCGVIGDGCGGTLSCGTCPAPATCGGSGVPNVCGSIG